MKRKTMVAFSFGLVLLTTLCVAILLKNSSFRPGTFRVDFILGPAIVMAALVQMALTVLANSHEKVVTVPSAEPSPKVATRLR